jgi:predicted lipoprotein with Yx(FWY)xxD motif
MSRRSIRSLGGLAAVSAASLAAVAGLAGPAGATGSPRAAAAASATVGLRSTSLGKILVNSRGRTLYAFAKDGRNKDRCAAIEGCTTTWPVVTARGKPRAGAGVSASKLGTITIAGGKHQVTYAGHPLYTYVADGSAGETAYVGVTEFGGKWLAVKASGSLKG